jgi:hypothetical protein
MKVDVAYLLKLFKICDTFQTRKNDDPDYSHSRLSGISTSSHRAIERVEVWMSTGSYFCPCWLRRGLLKVVSVVK